jgi:hypothetical protein
MNRISLRNACGRGAALVALIFGTYAPAAWAAGSIGQEFVIEPDNYAHTQVLNTVSPHVTLSTGAFSDNRPTFAVVAYTEAADASTGTKVFAHAGGIPFWNTGRTFRMDFQSLVTSIQLDYIASGFFDNAYSGRLEAYSPGGLLVDSYLTAPLGSGQFETMTVDAPQIAWALAYPPEDPFGDLDNLRFTVVPEPGAAVLIAMAGCGGLFVGGRSRRKA